MTPQHQQHQPPSPKHPIVQPNKPAPRLAFTKMQGLGNDFMVIDALTSPAVALTPSLIQHWSNRHTGIGFDQCLVIVPALHATHDFSYHIYNADGQEVEQCGNGARCIAEYLWQQGRTHKNELILSTPFDTVKALRIQPQRVAVTFPPPRSLDLQQSLMVNQQQVILDNIQLANPHVVIQVDDVSHAPVLAIGGVLSTHAHFPEGTNVEFVQVESKDRLRVRVYERGVGETQACGTGAMAAVVASQARGHCGSTVTVVLSGGELVIEWQGGNSAMIMTGSAITVFEGTIAIEHTSNLSNQSSQNNLSLHHSVIQGHQS